MSHLNQPHVKQVIPSSTNWESVIILSLIEIADKVIDESRMHREWAREPRGGSYEIRPARAA